MIGIGIGLMSGTTTRRVFTSSALGGFTSTDKLVSAAGQQVDFRPGKTIWLCFQSTGTINATTETILACASGTFGAGKGFWLTRAGAASGAAQGHFYVLAPGNNAVDLGAANAPALNGYTTICVVWRASDNAALVSINGGPLASAGVCPAVAVDSSCVTYIGGPEAGLGSVALTSGRILELAVWSTEATAAQAQAGTFTTGSRFILPASVTANAGTTFNFRPSRDWNGAASTVTTLGSSPITLTVSGAPTLTRVGEVRYSTLARNFLDSDFFSPQTDGSGNRYTVHDTYARFRLITDALSVGVETYSTMYATFAPQSMIGLYVNGTYTATQQMAQYAAPQLFDLQPGAGTGKVIDIWEGEQNETGGSLRIGTFVTAVRVPLYLSNGTTPVVTSIPVEVKPQKRLVLVGDSILTGFFASVPMQTSTPPLLRADYPTTGTGGVTSFTAGTESIHNLASSQVVADAFAAIIATECDGTASNTVWIQLGTNDYGFLSLSAATFATEYARLVDAIHVAKPGAILKLQSPIQRIAPSTEAANGQGSTLPNFRSAIQTIATARSSYCTYVEGGAAAIVSNVNMYSDGIHVGDAGFVEFKGFIKTTLAY